MVPDRKAQAGGATAEPIVVFDIGNVLLRWDPRFLYERIFDDRSKMESFLSEICTPEWNLELDRGGRFDEAVATLSAKHPNFEAEIRAFDERWLEMIPHAITDNVAVLAGLKAAGRPVYAITNFSAEKFRRGRRLGAGAAAQAGCGHLSGSVLALRAAGARLRLHRRFGCKY
jgi:2-haloacid dehalogenase